MSKRRLTVGLFALVAFLVASSVAGSQASHDRQVLGGPLLETDSARQQYADARAGFLRQLSSSGGSSDVRALVVFREYVAADLVTTVVNGLPVHYLRAGLVGNRPPVLEHFTVQCGSEANLVELQPAKFVDEYVTQLLFREIAHYEQGLESGKLPAVASEYLQALKGLAHSAHESLRVYAVGVIGSAADLIRLLDCGLVQIVDAADPQGCRIIEYSPQRPR